MDHGELLTNQAQPKMVLSLADLAFIDIALALVIDELLLLGYNELRIVLQSSQTRIGLLPVWWTPIRDPQG